MGKTVQIIPHVTDEVKRQWRETYDKEGAHVGLIEIGGTVGDIENTIFFEAVRQMRLEGEQMIVFHLTYVPIIQGEQKTKPTQQAVSLMLQKGLQPDAIICRSKSALNESSIAKVALFCNVPKDHVISNPDIESVYELPVIFKQQGMDSLIREKLSLPGKTRLEEWEKLVKNIQNPKSSVRIAVCGKYTAQRDAYISIREALVHAGAHLGINPVVEYIETDCSLPCLDKYTGIIVPGGFGSRGVEGKISAIKWARENNVPFLGLCFGMQLAVVEYSRNVCGLKDANSTEINPDTKNPVVCLLPEQRGIEKKGATMRLGTQDVSIKPKTKARRLFNADKIKRRFRHRYEVNPEFVERLEKAGLVFSGTTPDKKVMQLLELPNHPFFMASQFHPEFSSRLETPEPLFIEFLRAQSNKKSHSAKN
jgi:CTP synthase